MKDQAAGKVLGGGQGDREGKGRTGCGLAHNTAPAALLDTVSSMGCGRSARALAGYLARYWGPLRAMGHGRIPPRGQMFCGEQQLVPPI